MRVNDLERCGQYGGLGGSCITPADIEELWKLHSEVGVSAHVCVCVCVCVCVMCSGSTCMSVYLCTYVVCIHVCTCHVLQRHNTFSGASPWSL